MSENTEKDLEKEIQEEAVAQTAGTKEEVKEEKKKGFGKKENKKEKAKIEELEKKVEERENKVEELENKVAKDKDDYIRLMAEFDNFRRRTSQEKLELVSVASMDTIKGLLPVLDDCERALDVLRKSDDSDAAKDGAHLSQASGLPSEQGTCSDRGSRQGVRHRSS